MIDDRFSAASFQERGLDTAESRKLADLLAEEIQLEMHEVILRRMREVIQTLNDMGHNLQPYGLAMPGEIEFRDRDPEPRSGCRLRVGLDTVISTGYAHLIHIEEENEETSEPQTHE